MFERFTERARQVVVLAQQAAKDAERDRIDSVALLLGLIGETEGLAARSLTELKIDEARVREAWKPENTRETALARGDDPGKRPFTDAAQKILELALREALSLGHNYIGTEHILLGLARYRESDAATLLRAIFGLDAVRVRDEVLRVLSGPKVRVHSSLRGREPESDQKFRSFSHAWATGVVGAALVDSGSLSVSLNGEHPEMTVRIGRRSYRVIVEELQ